MKEATARIKINKLLEAAGWRFFADGRSPANIQLEHSVTLKTQCRRSRTPMQHHLHARPL